jgi:hypothetical protein
LPTRYALDVNTDSLDVLSHKRLLDEARLDPTTVSFAVRSVEVLHSRYREPSDSLPSPAFPEVRHPWQRQHLLLSRPAVACCSCSHPDLSASLGSCFYVVVLRYTLCCVAVACSNRPAGGSCSLGAAGSRFQSQLLDPHPTYRCAPASPAQLPCP